jgi:hypothetical protein
VARSHQTSLANHHAGLAVTQTGRIEVGPNLLQTILGNRLDIGLASLRQSNCLARFARRSKAGQGNNSGAQEAKYCQGRERFDHLRLLTVAVSRSRRARGSVHNSRSDEEFRKTRLIFEIGQFEIGQMAWCTRG